MVYIDAMTTEDVSSQVAPKGKKVPAFSPIFPHIRTSQISSLEVHLVYTDRNGDKALARVEGLPTHASWRDIQEKAGGGQFQVAAKGRKKGYIAQDKERLDGPPKFLNEVLAREEAEAEAAAEGTDEDVERDDLRATLKFNEGLMRQHSDAQARTLEALATAVSAANDKGNERAALLVQQMAGMTQQMQNMATLHATALSSMQQAHASEVASYVARVEALQKKLDELTGENAGYLKSIATATQSEGVVKAVKEIAGIAKDLGPGLPKALETIKGALGKGTNGASASEGAKQLGEGATKKLVYG